MASSWAQLARKSFGADGSKFHCPSQGVRTVQTEAQKLQAAVDRDLRERTSLVKSSLEEIRARFGNDLKYRSFWVCSDEYTWPQLTYQGLVCSVEDLIDQGCYHPDWRWWHGYSYEHDLLIQFRCKGQEALQVFFRFVPGTDYVSRLELAHEEQLARVENEDTENKAGDVMDEEDM